MTETLEAMLQVSIELKWWMLALIALVVTLAVVDSHTPPTGTPWDYYPANKKEDNHS